MLPPETLICLAGSGLGAGPATTAPVEMLYWLPWHGQSMVPLLTWLTMHPMWVQTALNALNSPAVGWVTTTCGPDRTSPPPTGILLVATSALPAGALLPPAAGAVVPAGVVPAAGGVAAAGVVAAGALLVVLPPQAVSAPARPTRPTPARMPRRVAAESVCGSCVTTAPVYVCGQCHRMGTLPCLSCIEERGVPLPGSHLRTRSGNHLAPPWPPKSQSVIEIFLTSI